MPDWVVDYVLLHELSHLLVASHGPEFWELLRGYPQLERAKAFLDGVSYATSRGFPGGADCGPDEPDPQAASDQQRASDPQAAPGSAQSPAENAAKILS